MGSNTSCQSIKDELFDARDKFLSTMKTYLTVLAHLEQVDTFKEFMAYVDRFTASECLFKIRAELGQEAIDELVDRIEENYDSSHTTIKGNENE